MSRDKILFERKCLGLVVDRQSRIYYLSTITYEILFDTDITFAPRVTCEHLKFSDVKKFRWINVKSCLYFKIIMTFHKSLES